MVVIRDTTHKKLPYKIKQWQKSTDKWSDAIISRAFVFIPVSVMREQTYLEDHIFIYNPYELFVCSLKFYGDPYNLEFPNQEDFSSRGTL